MFENHRGGRGIPDVGEDNGRARDVKIFEFFCQSGLDGGIDCSRCVRHVEGSLELVRLDMVLAISILSVPLSTKLYGHHRAWLGLVWIGSLSAKFQLFLLDEMVFEGIKLCILSSIGCKYTVDIYQSISMMVHWVQILQKSTYAEIEVDWTGRGSTDSTRKLYPGSDKLPPCYNLSNSGPKNEKDVFFNLPC